jgi:urease accessory protein
MKALLGCLTVALLWLGAPGEAQAHLVNTTLGDFYDGMLHPLTGFEDVLPWFALAILAAFQGPQRARWLLVAFPLGLLAGGGLWMVMPKIAYVSIAGAALIAVIGLAVATALVLPLPVTVALGVIVGVVHGYQNAQAMTELTDHLLFVSGVVATGYLCITLTSAIALTFLRGSGGWRVIALRAGGSWVAAVGIMVFGLQFATGTAT